MGFFTGQNYGYAKSSSPSDYAKTTPQPKPYGKIKKWVHASDHTKNVNPGSSEDSYSGFEGDVHWKDNPYLDEGWFPVWYSEGEVNTNANKGETATPTKSPEEVLTGLSNDLTNPNSKYYKDYADKLKGTLSAGTSIASLLGANKAMGLSMGSSALLANEQNKANLGKLNDTVTQATKDLFLSNTGNAINSSNSLMNYILGVKQLSQNQMQYNQTRKDSEWNQNMILLGNIPNQLNDIFGNTKVSTFDYFGKK